MTWSITALSNSTVSEGGTISYRLSRTHTGVETVHINTWQNWNGSGVYNGKDSSSGPTNAAGPDYNPVALVVNFGATQTIFDFTVTTLDNNSVPESSETFGIVAQTPSNSNANIAQFLATSGLRLTFESRRGFPAEWPHASLAHANRNFHYSQTC